MQTNEIKRQLRLTQNALDMLDTAQREPGSHRRIGAIHAQRLREEYKCTINCLLAKLRHVETTT